MKILIEDIKTFERYTFHSEVDCADFYDTYEHPENLLVLSEVQTII